MPDGRHHYDIASIAGIIEGKMILSGSPGQAVSEVLYDSRLLLSPGQSLFFALTGQRNDGHNYIQELYNKGVRNFVVSKTGIDQDKLLDANVILVKNTQRALRLLGAWHRKQFKYPVIGITGSNGKTVVKEWLIQLAGSAKNIVASPKSYNSQIGVPVSIWQMSEHYDLAIIEAGISQPGEMKHLQEMIRPDIGIFTNIGQAHDENFKDLREKVREKLILFRDAKTLIYCSDHSLIDEELKIDPRFSDKKLFTWGREHTNDLVIQSLQKLNDRSVITAEYKHQTISVSIPFTDDASLENTMQCWAVLLFLDFEPAFIAEQMLMLTPVAMRLELKEGINRCSVINDSYSLDLKSLSIALDFLEQQKQHAKKTVILSDFKQSGRNKLELYQEVAGLVRSKQVGKLIGIGPQISQYAHLFKMEARFYSDTFDFIENFDPDTFDNETILLKGARIFEFEKIGRLLQQKAHETVLEINLDALIHNLNFYRSKLDPDTRIMAMVKAFSYGSGSFEIANILQHHHIDWLAVAYADEGYELRNSGIRTPIMVMNPDRESMEAILKYRLEPEIYNFRTLSMLEKSIDDYNGDLQHKIPIHIKLDTGMRRLGFDASELDELIRRIKRIEQVKPVSIFSHLAASEDPDHDDFTRLQIAGFKEMSYRIKKGLGNNIMLHILNSAGILRFPEAHFDMVRLGISLYGISRDPEEQKQLQNVSSLRSTISQVKMVAAGETIGYNRQWETARDTKLGIVPIGYADGLSRVLGNGRGKMLVKGRMAPIIGNVCMDMCMLDITGMDVSEGDTVVVFGEEIPISILAENMGTIPYEILTGISRRVKRIYYQG